MPVLVLSPCKSQTLSKCLSHFFKKEKKREIKKKKEEEGTFAISDHKDKNQGAQEVVLDNAAHSAV